MGLGLGALEIARALRDRARAVRRAHRLVPGAAAHARRRERRARRRAAPRPQGGVGPRRAARDDAAELGGDGVPVRGRAGAARVRSALHFHGGYGFMEEYDIQLFYRRAKGWANVLDEPAREYARGSPTCATARSRPPRADDGLHPVARGRAVRRRGARADRARLHRRTPSARARHRHHARLGAAPGDGRPGLDPPGAARGARRRRPRARGAGGAVPRAGARRRALRRHEHLHDGGVGARARRQRDAAARDPAQAARAASRSSRSATPNPTPAPTSPPARTRAVRDGDGWRIDGQKIFTSLAEESEWVFLLTRTNLDVPKHRGLTFFLVPTSAPGLRAAADPHAVGQAHQHHLLRRRARRRRVARRRRRRRLAGDAGRAVVRARRRRWRARRANACWRWPRPTRATRSTTTVAR